MYKIKVSVVDLDGGAQPYELEIDAEKYVLNQGQSVKKTYEDESTRSYIVGGSKSMSIIAWEPDGKPDDNAIELLIQSLKLESENVK